MEELLCISCSKFLLIPYISKYNPEVDRAFPTSGKSKRAFPSWRTLQSAPSVQKAIFVKLKLTP